MVKPHDIVTLNGIESKKDHEIVQFQWMQVSGSPTAVIVKTTFNDEVRVSNLSAGVYKFRLTVTGDAGQSDSAEVTVLVLTPEQSHRLWKQPGATGHKAGYTVDGVPIHPSQGTITYTFTLPLIHYKHFGMPISLPCMSLDWGMKPEYLEETPTARGEHANSAHTGPRREYNPQT
ncbi:dyslexia-associated protein KIAA0319-like [Ictalurus furcatus]|uniref:dyslexia-associated protein KIAA0319-like n=1 Tax=Ictalurus furcatus TaxID=66913 RepID=UPI0023505CE2|nr:dyslexia-associated protein KIAA0319-like [Ictalurus furcatus]